jgi:hypothetical protein
MQEPAYEQMQVLDASAISILLDEDAPARMRSDLIFDHRHDAAMRCAASQDDRAILAGYM